MGAQTPDSQDAEKTLVLAYEATKEILKAQDNTLGNTRTRASGILNVAALLTSFSAGLGLIETDPSKGPVLHPATAWMLLIVLVGIGSLVLFVLWPAKAWHLGPDPSAMLDKRAAGESEISIRESSTRAMIVGLAHNRTKLKPRQRAFRLAIVLLIAEVGILILAIATAA